MIAGIYQEKLKEIPNLLFLGTMVDSYYIQIHGDKFSNGYHLCCINKYSGKIHLCGSLSLCTAVQTGPNAKLKLI